MLITMREKALFLAVYGQHFDAFARGDKSVEYRQWGKRWNDATLHPGRPVVVSRGYSGPRLLGHVVSWALVLARDVPDVLGIYRASDTLVAITLALQPETSRQESLRRNKRTPHKVARRSPSRRAS